MPTFRPSSPTRIVSLHVFAVRDTPPAWAATPPAPRLRVAVIHLGKEVRFHRGSRPGRSATLAPGLSLGRPQGAPSIEASDATGLHARHTHVVQETLRPASPRRSSWKARSIRNPRGMP